LHAGSECDVEVEDASYFLADGAFFLHCADEKVIEATRGEQGGMFDAVAGGFDFGPRPVKTESNNHEQKITEIDPEKAPKGLIAFEAVFIHAGFVPNQIALEYRKPNLRTD
jgi:hypothetical protein